MLLREQSLFLMIDVQEKLFRLMHDRETLLKNLGVLLQAVRLLDIPIVWAEQYPEGMGPTLSLLTRHLDGLSPIPKKSFSCWRHEPLQKAIQSLHPRRQVLVAGIETHVCVYQTGLDLLAAGYTVEVVADAVDSRRAENRTFALDRLRAAGAGITTTEMALFELLGSADDSFFKRIQPLVK